MAITKIRGRRRRAKLLALTEQLADLTRDRNIVAHTLPYSWDEKLNELAYYREITMTIPQIKNQPPYLATPDTFKLLAYDLREAGMWLAMFRQGHPDWNRDALFPWPDKFHGKLLNEKKTLLNIRGKRQAQRKSYAALWRPKGQELRRRRAAKRET